MKAKRNGRFSRGTALLLAAGLLFLSGSRAARAAEAPEAADAPIYEASLSGAEVLIDLPALRQYGGYTCGATCVQMLMNGLYPYAADLNLTQYEALLGTTPENGTPPDAVMAFFRESGVDFAAAQGLTPERLRAMLDAGHPVMLALQAWSAAEDGGYNLDDPADAETYLAEGHWVICVGYGHSAGKRYFIFNDPACVGRNLLYEEELECRWIDMDGAGTVYDHFGIEIRRRIAYDGNGLFHMD